MSLNPCFSGTYSQRIVDALNTAQQRSLNPCFSGTYSQSIMPASLEELDGKVLILVLVEHTLRVKEVNHLC